MAKSVVKQVGKHPTSPCNKLPQKPSQYNTTDVLISANGTDRADFLTDTYVEQEPVKREHPLEAAPPQIDSTPEAEAGSLADSVQSAAGHRAEVERIKASYQEQVEVLERVREGYEENDLFTDQYNQIDTDIFNLRIACDEEIVALYKAFNEETDAQAEECRQASLDARDLSEWARGG